MHPEVTNYIEEAPEDQRKVMDLLRQLVHQSVPTLTEDFKWSRPVFRTKKDFAYFKKEKAYVTLGFFNYQQLDDPDNLLEGTGKDMRHIKIKSVENIDLELLNQWFETAAD